MGMTRVEGNDSNPHERPNERANRSDRASKQRSTERRTQKPRNALIGRHGKPPSPWRRGRRDPMRNGALLLC